MLVSLSWRPMLFVTYRLFWRFQDFVYEHSVWGTFWICSQCFPRGFSRFMPTSSVVIRITIVGDECTADLSNATSFGYGSEAEEWGAGVG